MMLITIMGIKVSNNNQLSLSSPDHTYPKANFYIILV
jgi:hypothetical protein